VDEPLFLAQDVAKWIEHSNSRSMIEPLDEDEKVVVMPVVDDPVNNPYRVSQDTNNPPNDNRRTNVDIYTCYNEQLGQVFQPNTPYTFLTEDGLYEVLMLSRKPIAKQFKKQVKAILKEIRKTGSYSVVHQLRMPQTYPAALRELADVYERNERLYQANMNQAQQLTEAQPAKDFMEAVNLAHNSITVSDFAKALGIDSMGRNKLFTRLKNEGYLMHDNKPYQKYLEMGVFEVVEKVADTVGGMRVYTQTLITPKGQTYLFKKWNENVITLENACLEMAKDRAQQLFKEKLCG
jgi:anti-repressor protein